MVRCRKSVVVAVAAIAVVAGALAGGGCAYYNMLYNAKVKFKDAEKMPVPKDGKITRQQLEAYDIAIEKAEAMIEKYPDSRHVDDAYILIARARFNQENYEAAVTTVDTFLAKLPESDLVEEGHFIKGHAYVQWDKHVLALAELSSFIETYGKSDHMPQALYLASKSALILDEEEQASKYAERLRSRYRGSPYRLDADIELAEIYLQKGQYDKSVAIYENLTSSRLQKKNRFRVWSSLARAYLQIERYPEAIQALAEVRGLNLSHERQATAQLLRAEAFHGLKNNDGAILRYNDVVSRFPKSKFSAEAHFKLGMIYQEMDSLQTAKKHFDQVPRAYSGSEYAEPAIKKGSSIAQLIRLRSSEGQDSPEAKALRLFSMAEVQLFQFEDVDKALESYQQLLDEYPDSEFSPRAAYAIGYIYETRKNEAGKAIEAYMHLINTYPDSQQSDYAREALGMPPVVRETAPPDSAAADSTVTADAEETGAP
jgi:TolA-binding protein